MDGLLPFVLAPFLLAGLVAVLLWTDSGVRGWRRLASRFGTDAIDDDARRQDGSVGRSAILQLRGLIRARTTDNGLYIAAPRPLRLTHRPLLIPWDQITVREEKRRLGVPILTLSIGRVHLGFVTLRGGVAGEVLERLGR